MAGVVVTAFAAMLYVWTVLGLVLIAVAARDAFATLFQPTQTGRLNRGISHGTFRVLRGIARRLQFRRPDERAVLVLAGPLALLLLIASWALMMAVGGALIYLPHLPEEFVFASGLPPAEQDSFFDALYFSVSNLSTLGIGDMTPTSNWLRVVAVGEALAGVALITASVSLLLVINPAIGRKRTLAQTVAVYLGAADGSWETMLDRSPARTTAFLAEVTSQLATMRSDLRQLPLVYGFEVRDKRVILPRVLVHLCELVDTAQREDRPTEVRVEARALDQALGIYAATLRQTTLGGQDDTRATLNRYAHQHLVDHAARQRNEDPGAPGT